MVSYELLINNQSKDFFSLSFSDPLDFNEPGKFSALVPKEIDPSLGSSIEIKRNNTTIFKGILEAKTYQVSEQGILTKLEGRDLRVKLLKRVTGREFFNQTDPKNIIEALLVPSEPLQLNPQRIVIYPEQESTWVTNAYPNTPKGCNQTTLRIWTNAADLIFIKFDISSLAGHTISEAKLRLWKESWGYWPDTWGNPPNESARQVYVHRITSPWSCSTVTYNTRPSVYATATAQTDHTLNSQVWNEWTVTSDVQGWLNNSFPNYGWRLHLPDGNAVSYVYYASKNYAIEKYRPELVVTRNTSGIVWTTASASLNSANAWRAIDGDLNTAWESNQSQASGQWFQVDLGELKSINGITIAQDNTNFAKNWKIELSADGSNWAQIAANTNETQSTISVRFSAGNYRYAKMSITASDSAQWSIKEVYFYKPGTSVIEIGEISSYNQNVTMRFDFVPIAEAIAKINLATGYEAWVGLDGKFYWKLRRGSDKTNSVKFETGKNCEIVNYEISIRDIINSVTVIGHGEGKDQLRTTAQDQTSISQYGLREKTFAYNDIIDTNVLTMIANEILLIAKNPVVRVQLNAIDNFSTSFEAGDDVWLKASELGIDQAFKVYSVQRSFDDKGESVMVELRNRGLTLEQVLARLDAMAHTLASVDQSLTARSKAE